MKLQFILISIFINLALVFANPGDYIWSTCKDVHSSGVTIRNVCINMTEAQNCEVRVSVSVGGQNVVTQNMDMDVAPEVCGSYTQNGVHCDVCIAFDSDSTGENVCVTARPVCAGVTMPTAPIDCFPSSLLDGVRECQAVLCPNSCTGHGTCVNSTCQCQTGFYGDDCGSISPYWESCQSLSAMSADVCVKLIYEECNIKMDIVLESDVYEQPLYRASYPVTEFRAVFEKPTCVSVTPCQVCIGWDSLELTSTDASGCGSITFSCESLPSVSQPLGCFDDDTIVPSCFGTCPNLCSGRGLCNLGVCECVDGWTDTDCSVEVTCPNNCNGHGTCTSEGCKCNSGWEQEDCSQQTGDSSNGGNGGMSSLTVAAIVVTTLAGVAIIAGVAVYYIKKRIPVAQFSRLDLMEEEDTAATELKDDDYN